jgi:hypothetical protein
MTPLPSANRPKFSLASRGLGGEGWVRGAEGHAPPLPTSPFRRCATGPSPSPQMGGEWL